jgi:hypothetical protein
MSANLCDHRSPEDRRPYSALTMMSVSFELSEFGTSNVHFLLGV